MGVCTATLKKCCSLTINEVADVIEGEMKAVVGAHTRSGAALGAIHIENTGEFSRFVGGTGGEGTLHLFFLNDGNGGHRIYPTHARALYLKDYGIWRKSVNPYPGIHFVEAIAARHGG